MTILERRAQLLGADLGERGRVALALAATPTSNVDLPGGVDAHGGALEGAEAGALRIAREAHADATRGVFRLGGLAAAPVVVAEEPERALEGGGEIARS